MVYINECIDVNTALKKFLQIYELFIWLPRNFLRWQATGCIEIYSLKSMVPTTNLYGLPDRH